MKRITMALLAVAVVGGTAQADYGPYGPPPGAQGGGGAPAIPNNAGPYTPDVYGVHPCIKKLFHLGSAYRGSPGAVGGWFGSKGCHGCGTGPMSHVHAHMAQAHANMVNHLHNCADGYPFGMLQSTPGTMQGTLAFPHHPYVRSPRDYFMYEPAR